MRQAESIACSMYSIAIVGKIGARPMYKTFDSNVSAASSWQDFAEGSLTQNGQLLWLGSSLSLVLHVSRATPGIAVCTSATIIQLK